MGNVHTIIYIYKTDGGKVGEKNKHSTTVLGCGGRGGVGGVLQDVAKNRSCRQIVRSKCAK